MKLWTLYIFVSLIVLSETKTVGKCKEKTNDKIRTDSKVEKSKTEGKNDEIIAEKDSTVEKSKTETVGNIKTETAGKIEKDSTVEKSKTETAGKIVAGTDSTVEKKASQRQLAKLRQRLLLTKGQMEKNEEIKTEGKNDEIKLEPNGKSKIEPNGKGFAGTDSTVEKSQSETVGKIKTETVGNNKTEGKNDEIIPGIYSTVEKSIAGTDSTVEKSKTEGKNDDIKAETVGNNKTEGQNDEIIAAIYSTVEKSIAGTDSTVEKSIAGTESTVKKSKAEADDKSKTEKVAKSIVETDSTVKKSDGQDTNTCSCQTFMQRLDTVEMLLKTHEKVLQTIQENKPKVSRTIGCAVREVASNQLTGQSSDYSGYAKSSKNAVDGDLSTMAHTGNENQPNWWVDLGRTYQVERVEIYNRKDCCGERLRDLDIQVGPTLDNLSLCSHYDGPGKQGEHVIINCSEKIGGRYVKLVKQRAEWLHILEVRVYGCEIN